MALNEEEARTLGRIEATMEAQMQLAQLHRNETQTFHKEIKDKHEEVKKIAESAHDRIDAAETKVSMIKWTTSGLVSLGLGLYHFFGGN